MRSVRVGLCVGALLAATLSACSARATNTSDTAVSAPSSGAYNANAILTYSETEPANPLIPGDTVEVGGIGVLGALFRGLVSYNPATAAPRLAVAQSIRSTGSKVYTITLRPGWTFQDGTPVTAQSFVSAWNYTAYSPNLMAGASYLNHIQGFSQVNNAEPDGTQPAARPAATTMSGLKVISSRTFTVTLSAPFASFPTTLGYSAFFPLPASFYGNVKGYEAHPIGDGPFSFVSYAKGKDMLVKKYAGYAGPDKPKIGGIKFEFFANLDQAYSDVLHNKLDYLSFSPWNASPTKDLPANRQVNYKDLGYQAISFPLFDKRYDSVPLRQAISMAINRPALLRQTFGGVPQPADGLVPPDVAGYAPGQCGGLCTYQPAKARRMFDATGFKGPIVLTSNIDSGNQQWMVVVCRQLAQTLGHPCQFKAEPALGTFFTELENRTETAVFRAGWVADYPNIDDFLDPLFATSGSSNITGFSDPAVNALLTRADQAPTQAGAFRLYRQAERDVLQQMPTIPVWYLADTAVWSAQVHNIIPTKFRELDFTAVTISR